MCPNFHRSLSHGHLFLLFAINVQMPLGVPLKRGTLTTKWYAEITKESSVSWSKIWTVSSGWIGLQTHLSILRKKNGWVENNWFVLTFINKITNDWYFIASDIHYLFDHILFNLLESSRIIYTRRYLAWTWKRLKFAWFPWRWLQVFRDLNIAFARELFEAIGPTD